jgi:peptidoglycan/LPS O-acetylase OafA/YrhL
MPQLLSVYLDLVRFSASLIVFLSHASGMNWTGGFLWQTHQYADPCVIIFFVLSGFVIAYAIDIKEKDWRLYSANRISRIWSVAIPALLLTLVIDTIGLRIAPSLYIGQPWYPEDHSALRYFASFFMLQDVWSINLTPGTNGPFWSLSFEAFYYITFGLLYFLRGVFGWSLATFMMALAGPAIVALFPIWLLGYLAYHQLKWKQISLSFSTILFLAGSGILLLSPYLRSLETTGFRILGQEIFGRYFDAFGFYLNLLGVYGYSKHCKNFDPRFGRLTSKVAAITFPLYLCHRPLIQFFSYIVPVAPSSSARRFLVIGGTILAVILISALCEKLRASLRGISFNIFGLSVTLEASSKDNADTLLKKTSIPRS